jgi:hypothetical protein
MLPLNHLSYIQQQRAGFFEMVGEILYRHGLDDGVRLGEHCLEATFHHVDLPKLALCEYWAVSIDV